MNNYRIPIIFVILITFCVTLIMPATIAMASSPLDTLAQTLSSSSGNSSFNFFNVLIGMLLGNFLGKNNPSQNSTVNIKRIIPESADTNSPANSDKASSIIATAKTFMGSPYVWGGETTAGFDCSSFTQYVMKQNGITLPRTAAEQYEVGTHVDKSDLQVGDLIFFTTYKPGASHVGIYMGNHQFIHDSSAAKQVTISSLDTDFYKQHYIGARRYID